MEKTKRIQNGMAGAMDETIQHSDKMAPERYQQVVQAAQSNPDLQQTIMAEVEKERRRRNGQGR